MPKWNWWLTMAAGLAFLGLVNALTIDNHLVMNMENECYERVAIGEKIPDQNVYQMLNVKTMLECQFACSKANENCMALSFGIGTKGNTTCLLSKKPLPASLENGHSSRDPDYDLFSKKTGCRPNLNDHRPGTNDPYAGQNPGKPYGPENAGGYDYRPPPYRPSYPSRPPPYDNRPPPYDNRRPYDPRPSYDRPPSGPSSMDRPPYGSRYPPFRPERPPYDMGRPSGPSYGNRPYGNGGHYGGGYDHVNTSPRPIVTQNSDRYGGTVTSIITEILDKRCYHIHYRGFPNYSQFYSH